MSIQTVIDHQIAALTLNHAAHIIKKEPLEKTVKREKIKVIVNQICKGWKRSPARNLYIHCKIMHTISVSLPVKAFKAIYENSERLIDPCVKALTYSSSTKRSCGSAYIKDLVMTIPPFDIKISNLQVLNLPASAVQTNKQKTNQSLKNCAQFGYNYDAGDYLSLWNNSRSVTCDIKINGQFFIDQTLQLSSKQSQLYLTVFSFPSYEYELSSDGTFQFETDTLNIEYLLSHVNMTDTPLWSERINLEETHNLPSD